MVKKITETLHDTAYAIIATYANFDSLNKGFDYNFEDIDFADIAKLASLMMLEEKEYGSEATGPDNKKYETDMLPSLINYIGNIDDNDCRDQFLDEFIKGAVEYFEKSIRALLDDKLIEYNFDNLSDQAA